MLGFVVCWSERMFYRPVRKGTDEITRVMKHHEALCGALEH